MSWNDPCSNCGQPRHAGCGCYFKQYEDTNPTPSQPTLTEYTFDDIARAIVFGMDVERGDIPKLHEQYETLVDQFLNLKSINNGK